MDASPPFPDEHSDSGEFERQEDAFRDRISTDAAAEHPPETGRYHLYVSLACPWAHRTVIARRLLGLDDTVGLTVLDPVRDERGWAFRDGPGHGKDPVNGFSFLSEAYHATDPDYRGRYTVPVLWDSQTHRIVNNSEDDICRMFNERFPQHTAGGIDLFPKHHEQAQADLSDFVYETINNGVYKAGFASRQEVYEKAARQVFEALDSLEKRLASRRFLFGDRTVETDWRLFCTLIRFDPVYHGHFKCNLRRIVDYPVLHRYLLELYRIPGIAETVNFDHIKRHYYVTHPEINPSRIVPIGPVLDEFKAVES